MPDACLLVTNKPGTQVALQSIRAKSGVTWWQKVKAAWGREWPLPGGTIYPRTRDPWGCGFIGHWCTYHWMPLLGTAVTISRWLRATQIHLKLQECLLGSWDLKAKTRFQLPQSLVQYLLMWSHIFCCWNHICCHTIKCLPHRGCYSIRRHLFFDPKTAKSYESRKYNSVWIFRALAI